MKPSSAELSRIIRLLRRVRRYAAKKGLKAQSIQDLELAAEEILVNAACYAYPGRRGEIRVSCRFRHGAVEVEISDRGRPFDPTAYPDPDLSVPADQRPEGGMGIYIARHHLDGFHYRRDGGMNRVTLVKKKED
jgi:anti-sigma regulatory factor (Ser/Thr protein kinase)